MQLQKIILNFLFYFIFVANIAIADESNSSFNSPAKIFNLNNWKLQIPGPKDILVLKTYASKYFYLNKNKEMCFWVDASEKGTTKNAIYVRSELRHLSNWNINSYQKMTARLRVISKLKPDKVTVMKIHGFSEVGEYAPTLIRIALNDGDLYAYLNINSTPKNTERILLASNINTQIFQCTILVNKKTLIIKINGEEKINCDISYWIYKNYFKAGCYPQSHNGEVTVMFKHLAVE